jgi:hypothetical protein
MHGLNKNPGSRDRKHRILTKVMLAKFVLAQARGGYLENACKNKSFRARVPVITGMTP